MTIEQVSITPDMAAQWLATNTQNNRAQSKTIIQRYANDMMLDKWQATGEAIKFDQDGRLIDGQHRLAAIVASHQTITMLVIRGLPSQAIQAIDTGKSRSAGDALTIAGHNGQSLAMAALARKIIAYRGGQEQLLSGVKKITVGGRVITNRDIVEFCEKVDLTGHIKFGANTQYQSVTGALNSAEYSFFHWMFSRIDESAAAEFLTKLAMLENVGQDSPIRALLQKLTRSSIKLDGRMKLRAIIMAWNAFRTGQKLTSIHVGRIEANEPMPVAV